MILRTLTFFLALAIPTVWLVGRSPTEAGPPQPAKPASMEITNQHRVAAQLTYGLLSNGDYAYRARAATPTVAREVFDNYLQILDPQKLFFTQVDIQGLTAERDALPAALRGEDLAPALGIYRRWNDRVLTRLELAKRLVNERFDFQEMQAWHPRDRGTPWAADEPQLEAAWRAFVKNDWLRLKLAGQSDGAIRATLLKRYERMAMNVKQASADEAVSLFLNAYGAALDPHTNYLAPVVADTFAMSMSLSLEGIGAVLQAQDDTVVVRSLLPGGPAAKSGKLKVGDRILGVAQGDEPSVDVVGWRLDEVVRLIRGKGGTQVRLVVLAPEGTGEPQQITLVRDRVKLEEQAARQKVIAAGGRRVGVIALPGFYLDFEGRRAGKADARSATADVARLLGELRRQKVDAVVIDLRGNGGGSLTEAVELTGLFIDVGPVVQVRTSDGKIEVQSDSHPGVAWDGPLAVFVDRNSASASEIFAAAIQDYGRGIIVGENTYGKGTVQTIVNLDDFARDPGVRLGQVKLTIAQFFRINGGTTQRDGVTPDVAFPVTIDGDEAGESALPNALPPSRILPVSFEKIGHLAALLPALRTAHAQRAARTPQLRWWAEDVQEFRKNRDRKTLSLNETDRRREIRDRKDELAQRDRERARLGLKAIARHDDDGLIPLERSVADQVKAEEEAREQAQEDPLLNEAVRVLADALTADRPALSVTSADR